MTAATLWHPLHGAPPAPAPAAKAMTLRPYQRNAVDSIVEQIKAARSTLAVMPTGTGKTVVFAHLAGQVSSGRVMVLAHREELIDQAADKLAHITGEPVAVEMAGRWSDEYTEKSRIVVSSIQTQVAGMEGKGRMTRFTPSDFALLIVDEAHHAPAVSYRKVLDWYKANPDLKIVGVTATPDRADEAALGQVFDTVAFDYEINDAIRDGWLVPIMQTVVKVDGLDYSDVRTTAGDLNQGDLAAIMQFESNLHAIAHPTFEIANGRKTLVFATTVAQAERLCEILNRHQNNCARWLCGKTPTNDRREIFRDYRRGRFQFLVNVGVATEGFDDPGIEVVSIGRPTKSRALYAQMVGRGTRPHPDAGIDGCDAPDGRRALIAASGKPSLEIIDFAGNAGRHKLMTTADILGGNYDDEVVELAKRNVEKAAKPSDMADELERAKQQIIERKRVEAERRAHIKATADYRKSTIDPFGILDIEPQRERGWHVGRKPTEKQIAVLSQNGIDTKGLSLGKASQLIGQIFERRTKGLASFKQLKILNKRNVEGASEMTFQQASAAIDAIAKREGWGTR